MSHRKAQAVCCDTTVSSDEPKCILSHFAAHVKLQADASLCGKTEPWFAATRKEARVLCMRSDITGLPNNAVTTDWTEDICGLPGILSCDV